MKKYLLPLTLLLGSTLCANELSWVDQQVEAIKPPRKGMSPKELAGLQDPFIFLVKKDEKKAPSGVAPTPNLVTLPTQVVEAPPKPLILSLILNNKAMINDAWYKKGQKVEGYVVSEIHQNSVLLKSKKKKLLLSTRSSSKNLKFNNK